MLGGKERILGAVTLDPYLLRLTGFNERLFYTTFAAGADHLVRGDTADLSDHADRAGWADGGGPDAGDDVAEWGGCAGQ